LPEPGPVVDVDEVVVAVLVEIDVVEPPVVDVVVVVVVEVDTLEVELGVAAATGEG